MREASIHDDYVAGLRLPHRSKNFLLWLVVILLAGLASFIVYVVFLAEIQLQQAIVEADQLDPGWPLPELEARRRVVPDEQNSAWTLTQARAAMPLQWPSWDMSKSAENQGRTEEELQLLRESFGKLEPPELLSELQASELRRELKKVTAALVESRKLSDQDRGRFPIVYSSDYISTNLDHSQRVRQFANLLVYDVLLLAQDKDLEGALRSCRAILNAGRAIGDEPTLVSMLIRIAVRAVAFRKIERTLAQGLPSDAALAALQELLQKEAGDNLLLIGARGERALLDGLMQSIQSGAIPYKQVRGILGHTTQGEFGVEMLEHLELMLAGSMKSNRAAVLSFNNQFVEMAKMPVEMQKQALASLNEKVQDMPRLARALVPAFLKVAVAAHRDTADLRCATTLVALERYRLAKRHWPEKLRDLMPTFLNAVPLDPFDGAPLRYRRFEEGVIVYSVGEDGADDGGKLSDTPRSGTDRGMRLWDPVKRRQPHRPRQPNADD
jgi:hypothetical protein